MSRNENTDLIEPLVPYVSSKLSLIFPAFSTKTFSQFVTFKIKYIWHTSSPPPPYFPVLISIGNESISRQFISIIKFSNFVCPYLGYNSSD